MLRKAHIFSIAFLSLLLLLGQSDTLCQQVHTDNFRAFMQQMEINIPKANSNIFSEPTDIAIQDWSLILNLFRNHLTDSCRHILSKYNYELILLNDAITGNTYDIIREKIPVKNGWGTFIYNRNHKKRLYLHINHPLDDPHAFFIGTELFRHLGAEWLLVGGTSKRAVAGKIITDAGRSKHTIYQRWHEMLSDLTHVALSIHSYDESKFLFPISHTDIIVSNGRTSDEQWGISQISLAFRDTIRSMGFACGLSMYDSGYARLSGGWNVQGVFSNDSVGFGHWLYLELSKKIREKQSEYPKLISAIDRALGLTGKKISQQVNRGFGLVSPRVVRVDSLRGLFFPPENVEIYRIISFNTKNNKNDTIDVRMGNWIDLLGSKKNITAVTVLDTGSKELTQQTKRAKSPTVTSKIIEVPKRVTPLMNVKDGGNRDSADTDDDERLQEPLQVHRIPLKPVFRQTIENQTLSDVTPYKWEGIVPGWFKPNMQLFELSNEQIENTEIRNLPRFLIPIISSSYQSGKRKFIGVQMTNILVNEITRLVNQYQVDDKDLGLLAELSTEGDYYLRIFPSAVNRDEIAQRGK